MSSDHLLLVGYGGPTETRCASCDPLTCPGIATCFIRGILGDAPEKKPHVTEVATHYERMGGVSPFYALTVRQGEAIGAALRERGFEIPVHVGMRHWTPFLDEAVAQIAREGGRRIVAAIMAPHQSRVSWDEYLELTEAAVRGAGNGRLSVEFLGPWFDHPGFVEASVERVREVARQLGDERFAKARLVFCAHAIPVTAAQRSPYVTQLRSTAEEIAKRLDRPYDVAFQSAPEGTGISWLEPDINDYLRSCADTAGSSLKDVVVAPIGFVCDHVEVLYDLDTEARETAAARGLSLHRCATVGDHPSFIEMLAERAAERLR